MEQGRVRIESARDGGSYAQMHAQRASEELVDIPEPTQIDDFAPLPDALFSYFFQLQSQVEGDGFMDYHVYAIRLWEKFYGDVVDEDDGRVFNVFESRLISGLHGIDMRPIVYPHVRESLNGLVSSKAHDVRGVVLWSTGDVAATGYQNGKIDKSGIVQLFVRGLARLHPGDARELSEKTAYLVDDDKFERMADYLEDKADGERTKVVVIEDAVGNFAKVKRTLAERFGDAAQFDVVPVWATYSREGQNARAKAEQSSESWLAFQDQREELNAIDSFADLLEPRFAEILKDAFVFVDFDGVIGDNVAMRVEQAKVIYHALIEGGRLNGLSSEEIDTLISYSLAFLK